MRSVRSAVAASLAAAVAGGASAAPEQEDAAAFTAAAARYEAMLADDGQDFEARLGAARALNHVMSIRTNGNLPLVDGLQDTPGNRALWSELGERALEHARVAVQIRPDSVAAAGALATAYMYYSSSLGILAAIVRGAGDEYRTLARRVAALDERYDDALGDTLLAGFYLVAPWPIRDMDEARAAYERAARLVPDSARNQYGLGVYWARAGEPGRARERFERSLATPCSENSERLFCDFLRRESQRALAELKEE